MAHEDAATGIMRGLRSEKENSSQDEGNKPEGHALGDAKVDALRNRQFVRERGAREVFDAAVGTNKQPHDCDQSSEQPSHNLIMLQRCAAGNSLFVPSPDGTGLETTRARVPPRALVCEA